MSKLEGAGRGLKTLTKPFAIPVPNANAPTSLKKSETPPKNSAKNCPEGSTRLMGLLGT